MMIKNPFSKVKRRHLVLIICAGILFFVVKMCEADDYSQQHQETVDEIDEIHETQDSVFNMVDELLEDYQAERDKTSTEIDSLMREMLNNDSLSQEEINDLIELIEDKEDYIEQLELEQEILVNETTVDTVDTIVYNEIHVDTVIIDTVVEYVIVKDTVIQVDTIVYDPEDVKIKEKKKKKDRG